MKLPWILWALLLLAALAAGAKYYFDNYWPISRDVITPQREACNTLLQIWTWEDYFHSEKLRESADRPPRNAYGSLREVIEYTKLPLDYKWSPDSTFEHQEYCYRAYLPNGPEQTDTWCAVAWPAKAERRQDWHCFLIDSRNNLYMSAKPVGHIPQLGDLFEGKPFASRVSGERWTLRQR